MDGKPNNALKCGMDSAVSEGIGCDSAAPLLSGDIRFFRAPEIMHLISVQRLTGRLRLICNDKNVDVFFRDGDVAFASGERRASREQLGQLLVMMGRIDEGQLEEALSRTARGEGRLGTILVEGGYADAESIRTALMKQTERSIYRALAWTRGRFEFSICEMPEFVEDFPLGLPTDGMIFEGVRRVEQMRIISEKIPDLSIRFSRHLDEVANVGEQGLAGPEQIVARLVDGTRDVDEIIKASGMTEFTVLKALYALFSTGAIRRDRQSKSDDRTSYL